MKTGVLKIVELSRTELINTRRKFCQQALERLNFKDKSQMLISWDIENRLVPDRCDITIDPDPYSCVNAIKCLLRYISENEDVCSVVLCRIDDEDLLEKEYKSRVMHIWSLLNYLKHYDFERYLSKNEMIELIRTEYDLSEGRREEQALDVSGQRLTPEELIDEIETIAAYINCKIVI